MLFVYEWFDMTEINLPKVTISILTYNRVAILKELLNSLLGLTYPVLEIILTDNDSNDGTEALVRSEFPTVDYYRMPKNVGVGARNEGLCKASGEIVITLDDDVVGIDDEKILAIVHLFNKYPKVGAICFKVLDYYSGEICNWCHHYKQEQFSRQEFITDEISEGAVAFRKFALDETGLYPSYFFISYEGADMACRLLHAGYLTMYSPQISVSHRHAAQGRPNWRRYYFDTRNQIWFVARNYPVLMGLKYLLRGLSAMLFYSLRDSFLRYWTAGIWHGIRALPMVIQDRKCLNDHALRTLRHISSHRPGVIYMARKRLLRKGVRI
jgi:GT2 family glycosyltransferase